MMSRPRFWMHPFALIAVAFVPVALLVAFMGWLGFLLSFQFSPTDGAIGQALNWENTSLWAAIFGTLQLLFFTMVVSLPIGMGAGLYMEELRRRDEWTAPLERIVAALAGLPSVLYGLVGLMVFVRWIGNQVTLLTAACTLSLVALPMIVLTTRDALRNVGTSVRESARALGTTPYQEIRFVVLPLALPYMISGGVLSVIRVMGEAAPLLLLGAWAYHSFIPSSLSDAMAALPLHIYTRGIRSDAASQSEAALGVVLLLLLLFASQAGVIAIRKRILRAR